MQEFPHALPVEQYLQQALTGGPDGTEGEAGCVGVVAVGVGGMQFLRYQERSYSDRYCVPRIALQLARLAGVDVGSLVGEGVAVAVGVEVGAGPHSATKLLTSVESQPVSVRVLTR